MPIVDNGKGFALNPFTLSITLTDNKLIKKSCSICGSRRYRIPFDVIDDNRDPICWECCKDINFNLFLLVYQFFQTYGNYTFSIVSEADSVYDGVWGMIRYDKTEQRFIDFFKGFLNIMDKFEIGQFLQMNMNENSSQSKSYYHLDNPVFWEPSERETKEYLSAHPSEASEIRYFMIINRKMAFDKSGLDFGPEWRWRDDVCYGTNE